MVLSRMVYRTGCRASVLLILLVVLSPMVAAQNINDLLRILLPQSASQPPSPVRAPGEYAPPQPAPRPYTPRPAQPPATPQVPLEQVMQMQQMLNDLGYDAGVADGVAGRRTIDALNAFRRDNGLATSATIDKQSVTALSAAVSSSTTAPTAVKPSFDCARAGSRTEVAICGDAALSVLDAQLATLYAQELSRRGPQDARLLKVEQRKWISQRDKCSGEPACLLNAYAQRIASITSPATAVERLSSGTTQGAGAYVSAPVTARPHEDALVVNDATGGEPQVTASGSDLRALATPPYGLRPIAFRYFDGVPILEPTSSGHLFTLMGVADQLPPATIECSVLRKPLLTEEVVKQFMGAQEYQCWQGKDEFQIADTRRDFYARYLGVIKSFAPKPPFRFVFVQTNSLGPYDANLGQFRLVRNMSEGLTSSIRFGSSRQLMMSIGSSWPEPILPANEAVARDLLQRARAWAHMDLTTKKMVSSGRDVSVVGVIDVKSVDYAAQRVDVGLVSLSLYDPGLKEKVYEFPVSPSFDALIRGNIPERFKMPSPARLDSLYALVQAVWYDKRTDEEVDLRWRELYGSVRQRDKAFYAAKPQEKLSDDDVRLPVFTENAAHFTESDREKLEKWAAAYRAGLSSELEAYSSLDRQNAATDMERSRYLFTPLGYRSSDLEDYTKVLEDEGVQKEQVSRWRVSPYVNMLFIVPNRLDLYTLAVEKSKLPDAGLHQRARFRAGPIKPVTDSKGKRVLLVRLEPISLAIENNEGVVIAQQTYQDVPRLDDSFVAEQQKSKPAATADGPLALSPALLDLIALNTLGEKLSEPAMAHMAARRWRFENGKEPVVGGRFFVEGKRQPKAHELAEIVPKFRVWAASAVPATPLLRIGARVSDASLSDLRLWPSRTVDWSVLRCSGSAAQRSNHRYSVKRDAAALEDYSALMKHDHNNRNKIESENSLLESVRKFDQAVYNETGIQNWTSENDEKLVNLKAAFGIWDRFQRIGDTCGLSAEDLGYPNPAAVYLQMRDALPAAELALNAPALNAEVMLEITGAHLAPREPHYSDLLPPEIVQTYQLAPVKRVPMEAIVLESRLKEVVYFDQSGKEIARLTPNAALSIQGLLASIKDFKAAQASAQAKVKELDVIGIKLGMTLEEAESIIRKHMDVGRVLEGKRLYDGSLKSSRIIPATSGKLFVSKDEREIIAILDEPPAVSGKVLAAWRRVYIPAGTLLPAEALAGLKEKYGDPVISSKRVHGNVYAWSPKGERDCAFFSRSGPESALSAIWTDKGERIELKHSDGRPIPDGMLPAPYRDPSNPEYKRVKDCGSIVATQLDFEASGKMNIGFKQPGMDWIEQSLTNPKAYMQAFQASREAAKDDPQNNEARVGGLTF